MNLPGRGNGAVETGLLGLTRFRRNIPANSIRKSHSNFPLERLPVETGQHGHPYYRGSVAGKSLSRLRGRRGGSAHHGHASHHVHVEYVGAHSHRPRGRSGHGIRDIMELQVEEDGFSRRLQLSDDLGTGRRE